MESFTIRKINETIDYSQISGHDVGIIHSKEQNKIQLFTMFIKFFNGRKKEIRSRMKLGKLLGFSSRWSDIEKEAEKEALEYSMFFFRNLSDVQRFDYAPALEFRRKSTNAFINGIKGVIPEIGSNSGNERARVGKDNNKELVELLNSILKAEKAEHAG